ncbi:unnamed protein product [Gulo gulo]|uniref:Uncharacterized protein n=1 Tax=Gulo gulo TaxID=48420 RepID=A0A9X9Q3D9_GULGU|nr:unnamed protein product [Gulo gulo]
MPIKCRAQDVSHIFGSFYLHGACFYSLTVHPGHHLTPPSPAVGCHDNPSHSSGLTQWLSSFPRKSMKKERKKNPTHSHLNMESKEVKRIESTLENHGSRALGDGGNVGQRAQSCSNEG